MHLLNRLHRIGPLLARRIEIEFMAKLLHEHFVHALPDPHRPVALHVRMTAHRTRTRSRTPDVPAEEEEIHDLLNSRDRVPMLGQSHRPTTNDAFRIDRDLTCGPNLFPCDAAAHKDVVPIRGLQILDETIEASCEILDKVLVEDRAGPLPLFGQHLFHDPFQHRDVAVDSDRHPEIAQLQALAEQQSRYAQRILQVLRIFESEITDLRHRIDRNYFCSCLFRLLETVQHPRVIRSRILADDKNRVSVREVR